MSDMVVRETVGFWQGLGMAWSSLVMAVVKALGAGEKLAEGTYNLANSACKGTEVLHLQVQGWHVEELKKLPKAE